MEAAMTRRRVLADSEILGWADAAPAVAQGPETLAPIVERIRPYTMVPERSLVELARQVSAILALQIPGDFVECGVWRGGASFLMAELLRQAGASDRRVWLFDSFEGLPPPAAIDGARALAYPGDRASPWYHDNCRASLEDVQGTATALDLGDWTRLVKGWFETTLPTYRDRIGRIALLRIDGDWYSSVRSCLDNLYDRVVDGGLVILDDYYAWDGCAIATHEFLGSRRLGHRIEGLIGRAEGVDAFESAVFRKGGGRTTWQWMYQLYLVARDIASCIPAGGRMILVDQAQFDATIAAGRHVIPFLEHDGQYGGIPKDDDVAISELERLQGAGARFIVFGWPAFWWLEHYLKFHAYLRSRFNVVLHNDRLIVFDMTGVE
jgi:O-methyltransferase